MPSPLCLRAC